MYRMAVAPWYKLSCKTTEWHGSKITLPSFLPFTLGTRCYCPASACMSVQIGRAPRWGLEPSTAWLLHSVLNPPASTQGNPSPAGKAQSPATSSRVDGEGGGNSFCRTLSSSPLFCTPNGAEGDEMPRNGIAKPPPGISRKCFTLSPVRKGTLICRLANPSPAAATTHLCPFLSPSLPALSSCCCFCEGRRGNLRGATGR